MLQCDAKASIKTSEDILLAMYIATRDASLVLCETLEIDDFALQAMPNVSPPKWHLAHTTWFFETFILKPFVSDYRVFHPQFEYMFNSYYNAVGEQFPRPQRGLLSRPTVSEVFSYRKYVDDAMAELLCMEGHKDDDEIRQRCELGIQHEQQHQELICTDIKYSFSFNPLYPALRHNSKPGLTSQSLDFIFHDVEAEDVTIGYQGSEFHFDNETPVHRFYQAGFRFANRLVTNAEYMEFLQDAGYETASIWLSDGWTWLQTNGARHPLYWVQQEGEWFEYTLHGLMPIDPYAPVSHVNFYEADAYARWRGNRLPTEQEWEIVCNRYGLSPEYQSVSLHPQSEASSDAGSDTSQELIVQMFDQLWQWTGSSYSPYPGYRASAGAIGEYNGKFMCNQMVLKGSSCVTQPGHARATYRNFFYPSDQWQFSGIRLADDIG